MRIKEYVCGFLCGAAVVSLLWSGSSVLDEIHHQQQEIQRIETFLAAVAGGGR